MINAHDFINDLIDFIDKSPVNYFAVKNSAEILEENGYERLYEDEKWNLKDNGKYYIIRDDSALIAFNIGDLLSGFDIIGSHTDSPTFKIKSKPEIKDSGYLKLNIENYGGMIYSTWLDRSLSLAGKVSYIKDDAINKALIDFKKPLLTIPNLAIHMNREVNNGFIYNPQNHLYPILKTIDEEFSEKDYLKKLLSEEIGVDIEDILDYDLGLYDTEGGKIIGDDIYQIGRIDNLGAVHASLRAFVDSDLSNNNILVLNDNEEIGSMTRTGAFSPFLEHILKRIFISKGFTEEDYYISLSKTYLISADQAHALHPNFKEKSDPTNKIKMNGGVVIKMASNGSYTSSVVTNGRFIRLAEKSKCNYQTFYNRNDLKGGTTIGPIAATKLGIKSIDIGEPILGMHSIRETGGIYDHLDSYKIFKSFYEDELR